MRRIVLATQEKKSDSGAIRSLGWYPGSGPEKRERILEDRLKELLRELGNAINDSLSDSERIAGAIGEIRRAGYDVFLVLEATIGLNRRDEEEAGQAGAASELGEPATQSRSSSGKIRWTSQDQKFLRALKISIEEEKR